MSQLQTAVIPHPSEPDGPTLMGAVCVMGRWIVGRVDRDSSPSAAGLTELLLFCT